MSPGENSPPEGERTERDVTEGNGDAVARPLATVHDGPDATADTDAAVDTPKTADTDATADTRGAVDIDATADTGEAAEEPIDDQRPGRFAPPAPGAGPPEGSDRAGSSGELEDADVPDTGAVATDAEAPAGDADPNADPDPDPDPDGPGGADASSSTEAPHAETDAGHDIDDHQDRGGDGHGDGSEGSPVDGAATTPDDEPATAGGATFVDAGAAPDAEVPPDDGGDAAVAPPLLAPAPDPLLPVGPRAPSGWPVIGAGVVLFFVVVSLPLWVGQTGSAFLVDLLVLVSLAQWWGLLAGFAGTPSLAGGFYAGAGTYLWTALVQWGGLNPVVAVAVAAVAVGLLALPTGWLLLRPAPAWTALSGLALTAAAAAFVTVVDDESVDGRVVAAVSTLGTTLRRSLTTWLAVVVGVGSVVAAVAIRRSRLGLAAVAHRDEPEAASTLGVRAGWARLLIWTMAAVAAATAGAIISFRQGTVSVDSAFDPAVWVLPAIVAAALGGMRSLSGPPVGALVYLVMERLFGAPAALALCATAAVVLMVFVPRGVAEHARPRVQGWLDPHLAGLRGVSRRSASSTAPVAEP